MSTAVNAPLGAGLHCPGCLSPIGTGAPRCSSCGIWLAGPEAAEIRWIDAELTRVDAARTWLISRRAQLLDDLTRLRSQAAAESALPAPGLLAPGLPARPDRAAPHVASPAGRRQRPEISGRTAARLLLGAGAALVAIAVTIFTVAGWSRIGPLGRCGILLAVTAGVLAAPRQFVRRGLRATAEAVAATGLVLTIGDAYLIHRFTGLRIGPLTAAALCAAGAAAWAAYGTAIKLRGPRLAAIGLGQLIAPLTFVSAADLTGGRLAPIAGPAAGLIVTAALDVLLADLLSRHGVPEPDEAGQRRADGRVAAVAAAVAWACGVVAAIIGLAALIGWHARHGGSWSDAVWLAVVLWAAAVVGTAGAARLADLESLARPATVLSGALAGIGLAVVSSPALSSGWDLVCAGGCGLCLSVAALISGPRAGRAAARRRDFAAGSVALLATATAIVAPTALASLIPAQQVLPAWSGSAGARSWQAIWPGPRAAITLLTLCALGCLLAQYGRTAVPARFRSPAAVAGLIAAAAAAGSLPAAAGLTGWAALTELTAGAVIMLAASAVVRERTFAAAAAGCGCVLALTAAAWSLAGRATTIAELAVLAVAFGLLAARARHAVVVATTGALAAATGLAWAAPLAAGQTAEQAALAGLGAAVAAVAVATAVRRARPSQAAVLDAGAGLAALLAAVVATRQRDAFAVVAVTSALAGSCAAWLRTGRQRSVAAATAACAAMAAILASAGPLGRAMLTPARFLAHPWRQPVPSAGWPHPAGLSLAVVVLAACLAALAAAAGAWRGGRRASMHAVAVALPLVAAPAGLAGLDGGLGYLIVTGALLALTLGLTAWAARGESLAPAGAALVSAALTAAWALAAPIPTVTVLGVLAAAYGLCAWRSRLAVVRIAAGCLSVFSSAAFAEAVVLAAGLAAWQAGLAALGVAAAAQIAAAAIAFGRSPRAGRPNTALHAGETGSDLAAGVAASLAVEVAGWLVAAAGAIGCLGRPWTASAATAIAGVTCLCVAVRPDRRAAAWPGIALCYAAWCIGLAAGGVSAAEPYTLPAAAVAIAAGWRASRREPRPHSWLALGPGLALLLLPSLIVAWDGTGWIRPALTGLAAIGIAIAGARTRTLAPLLTGSAVAVLDAGRALAPDVMRLVHAIPGWVPIAAGGAVLLWAGATYEARLRNLQTIRRSLAAMS